MTDPTLLQTQRRERFLRTLDLLQKRYTDAFGEPLDTHLISWLDKRIEEEKVAAIKDALSHLEAGELLEIRSLVSEIKESPLSALRTAKCPPGRPKKVP